MPKQELDLVQCATSEVAESGARAPKIMWGELFNSCT